MKFFSNCKASVIVEFAILFPLFVFISLLSLDVALYLFDRQTASRLLSSQVTELAEHQSVSEEIRSALLLDLGGMIGSQKFFRTIPSNEIALTSVCLCSGENLVNTNLADEYPCPTQPRCDPIVRRYNLVSVDFSIDSDAFFLSNPLSLAPFTETVVIRSK